MIYTPFQICKEVAKVTSSVIVSFSGGKDSFVVLDICNQYFKTINAFFLYVVDNLEFQNRLLEYAEDRYKIKIKKYPHPILSKYLRNGIYTYEAYENKVYRWGDIENLARNDFKAEWIASGWKKTDSLQRRGALSTYEMDSINRKSKKFYPLSNWDTTQVINYMKLKKLSYKKTEISDQFEVELTYKKLNHIRKNYPDDYEKIKKQFPFCETIFRRKKFYSEGNSYDI